MTGSWKGRGNQYIQLIKVLYCKLPTNDKQLPAFPLEVGPGTKPQSQRWEVRLLPLWHRDPSQAALKHAPTCYQSKHDTYTTPMYLYVGRIVFAVHTVQIYTKD